MSDARPTAEDLVAHAGFVRAVARRILLDEDRSDDVVQETFLAALEPAVSPRRNLRAWLAGVARNLARTRVRSDDRRARRDAMPRPARADESPAEIAERMDTQRRLVAAVSDLEEPFRETIVRRFFDDATPTEVGERMGVPAATVRSRTRRALAMLRGRLDREHDGDRRRWALALLPLARLRLGDPAAVATGAAVTGGLIAMKTAIAVGLVLLVLIVIAIRGFTGDSETPDRERTAERPEPPPDTPEDVAAGGGDDDDAAASDPSREIRGVVVDATGTVVAGARVEIRPRPWSRLELTDLEVPRAEGPSRVTTTGPDGRFRAALAPGEEVDVRVVTESGERGALRRARPGTEVRVVVGGGARIEVTARDEAGYPVSGASVHLVELAMRDDPVLEAVLETDDAGQCVFTDVAGPGVGLFATHERFGHPHIERMMVRPGLSRTVVVELTPGRDVRGRVKDAATGEPVSAAWLRVIPHLGPKTGCAADGTFLIERWTGRASPWIQAGAEGYSSIGVAVPAAGELVVSLPRADEAIGRVVDAAGRPVRGARLAIRPIPPPGRSDLTATVRTSTTGADGRFRTTGLRREPGGYRVLVGATGRGTIVQRIEPREGQPGAIDLGDLVLPEGRRVAGRVLDAAGAPRPRTCVMLVAPGEPGRGLPVLRVERQLTDARGRFAFVDVAPGPYGLAAMISGPEGRRRELMVPEGQDVLGLEIRDAPPSRGPRPGRPPEVRVRVLDARGAPLPGVSVTIPADPRGEGERDSTGHDGRARLRATRDGPVTVRIDIPTFRLGTRTLEAVEPGGDEIEITLEGVVLVRGRVLGPDGKPLYRMIVAMYQGGTLGLRTTDAEGVFLMPVAAGVPFDLAVNGAHMDPKTYMPVDEKIPVSAVVRDLLDPTDLVMVRCVPDESSHPLEVLVLDPDGRPLAGAEVRIEGRLNGLWHRKTDADGLVRLEDCRRERIRISVTAGDLEAPGPVEILVGGPRVVIELPREE